MGEPFDEFEVAAATAACGMATTCGASCFAMVIVCGGGGAGCVARFCIACLACLACLAATFSLMDCSAVATDGGNGMVAGLSGAGCWMICTWFALPFMFRTSLGKGWLGRDTVCWTTMVFVSPGEACPLLSIPAGNAGSTAAPPAAATEAAVGGPVTGAVAASAVGALALAPACCVWAAACAAFTAAMACGLPGMGAACPAWLCEAWCLRSSRLSLYPRAQTAQTKGFSPVWIRTWVTYRSRRRNPLPHVSHLQCELLEKASNVTQYPMNRDLCYDECSRY